MRFQKVAALVIFMFTCVPLVGAQETTGRITGRITDTQGLAVPAATVTATGQQGVKSTTTDADGRFVIPFLTPGVYDVRAELPGFKAVEQKNVIVSLAQTVDLPLKLEVGGVTETVNITASSPIVDTTKSSADTILDSATLARLPVGRALADTLYIAPGVASGGGTGTSNPSIGGASGLENQYIVDGVNISSAGFGTLGSYSRVAALGALGNGVTYDFIKEVQVKTAGYEAEFGQSTGGVVNVITKSGTNNIRGTGFGYWRPDKLESDYTQITTTNGWVNVTGTQQSDFGVEIGGPVVKDRLFFFGAIDPQWQRKTLIAPEGFPLRSLGPLDQKRKFISYSAKGTFQMSSGHQVDASFFGDPGSGDPGPQRGEGSGSTAALRGSTIVNGVPATFSSFDRFGGHNQVVRYQGVLSPTFLVEASWAHAKNETTELPAVDQWQVTDRTTSPEGLFGGLGFFENNAGANKQYQAKATTILGNNQFRYGLAFEDITFDDIPNYSGPTFTYPNGQRSVTGAQIDVLPDPVYGRIYRATRGNYVLGRHTEQQYFNFFVQDTLKIGQRITIRPGIRYEQQKLVGSVTDFTWNNNWAPRIGATYDPTGSGKAKIFANWGRFYAKVPNDLAARALSADAGISRADYFDAALTQPIPEGLDAASTTRHFILAGTAASDFDPNAKSTYLDEALVGFEVEAVPRLSLGVRYIHRNMPRILEDVGTAAMVLYENGLPAPYSQYTSQLGSVEYFITNPGSNYPATLGDVGAFEAPIHKYDAVEFTAERRLADNWSVQASYRWSRLYGTFEGFYRNDNGQSDPAISSLFDFPTNDPLYTQIGAPLYGYRGDIRFLGAAGAGPLPNDRPHQLKIYGTYNLPVGVNLAVGLQLSSGTPLTALAANPNYASSGEIPEGPRGSGIQTVDGFKTRTPFEAAVNFHVDYALKLTGNQQLTLLADVFNLGNLQRVVGYDNYTQTTFVPFVINNPDYGAVGSRVTRQGYQTPQQIRVGIRYGF